MTALYNGHLASYVLQMQQFKALFAQMENSEQDALLLARMDSIKRQLTEELHRYKNDFTRRWMNKKEQVRPALIPLGYMEYVPGKPLVIPKKIRGKDGRIVQTDSIFRNLLKTYHDNFAAFIEDGLGIPAQASPQEIIRGVEQFMERLELAVEEVMPGDLSSSQGVGEFISTSCRCGKPSHVHRADR